MVFVFDGAAGPKDLPCKLRNLGPCNASCGPLPTEDDPDNPPYRCVPRPKHRWTLIGSQGGKPVVAHLGSKSDAEGISSIPFSDDLANVAMSWHLSWQPTFGDFDDLIDWTQTKEARVDIDKKSTEKGAWVPTGKLAPVEIYDSDMILKQRFIVEGAATLRLPRIGILFQPRLEFGPVPQPLNGFNSTTSSSTPNPLAMPTAAAAIISPPRRPPMPSY